MLLKWIEEHPFKVVQRNGVTDAGDDPYAHHSGRFGNTSIRTIWESPDQCRLLLLGVAWYALQSFMYIVLANILVYITFHEVPAQSPSSAGELSVKATGATLKKDELFDLGFLLTPDWSHRPWWLKFLFVDLNVQVAQVLPPLVLTLAGRTQDLIAYLGTIGIINLCKGVVQMVTVLPPANGGEFCWTFNFSSEQLEVIRGASFGTWFFQTWGASHGCNDMLWSGHTAQSTVGFLFLNHSMEHLGVPAYVRFLLIPYIITYWFAVLACRMHYTIDVLVATLLACSIYTHDRHLTWVWTWANKVLGNTKVEGGAVPLNA